MKKIILTTIATLLLTLASAGVASASMIYWYQPELPEE
ncbi:MAG: cyclic lactone autoinducer peptide [bacterium]